MPNKTISNEINKRFERFFWKIGMVSGTSPLSLRTDESRTNPVMTGDDIHDCNAIMVADPFMIQYQNAWHLFCEVYNADTGRGEIGYAYGGQDMSWQYKGAVLQEPFHISYPYVFEHEGDIFMIPETLKPEAVRLYRAKHFPYEWIHSHTLLEGTHADPSVFFHNGLWWMFTCPRLRENDCLMLYFSESLFGPWQPHTQNPVRELDPERSRPAGRIIKWNETLLRFAQVCTPEYGVKVRAFEITTLTPTVYQDQEVKESPILQNGLDSWCPNGVHHIDAHQIGADSWIACIDGR